MSEVKHNHLALAIEQAQRIQVGADGTTTHGSEIYIKKYIGLLESGLLARLSGNANKLLDALGLRARILGDFEHPRAEEEFQELVAIGLVEQTDKGKLFCFPSREQLMQDTGIGSAHTIDAALAELGELKLVQRVSPIQPRMGGGRFGSNLYLISPRGILGKFDNGSRERILPSVGSIGGEHQLPSVSPKENLDKSGGEQELPSAYAAESNPRQAVDCLLKNKEDQNEKEELDIIATHFAHAIGQPEYALNVREIRKVSALLRAGYSVDEISSEITRVIERARERGRTVRSIAYCVPAVWTTKPRGGSATAESGSLELRTRSAQTHAAAPEPRAASGQPQAIPPKHPHRVDGKAELGSPKAATQSGGIDGLSSIHPRGVKDSVDPGPPSSETEAGQPHSVSSANPLGSPKSELDEWSGGDQELRELLEIVQERNPGRMLQKSDVRVWQAVAERFSELAAACGATPLGLVTQAVLKGIGANSDRAGFFAPSLAEAILSKWPRPETVSLGAGSDPALEDQMTSYLHRETEIGSAFTMSASSNETLAASEIWEIALRELQGQMTKATYDSWVRPTFVAEAVEGEPATLVIGTRHPYAAEWLRTRLHTTIVRTITGIVGRQVMVEYRCVGPSAERGSARE